MSTNSNDGSELLVVVIDATPQTWSALDATARAIDEAAALQGSTASVSSVPVGTSTNSNRRLTFGEFVSHLELFLATFACASRKNQLAVLAYNGTEGGYLYPPLAPGSTTSSTVTTNVSLSSSSSSINSSGTTTTATTTTTTTDIRSDILRSAVIKKYVHQGLLRLRYGEPEASSSVLNPSLLNSLSLHNRSSSLGSCLTSALCYINKQKGFFSNTASTANNIDPTNPNQANYHKLRSRIIVFQASPDIPAQYIPIINVVCSSVRYSIPMDSVILGTHASVFLQQAALLTNAQHLIPSPNVGHFNGFYQYLVTLLLPDSRTRNDMLLPPQSNVNLRAHCFCHQKYVTTAWLCYVCLSIWCKPLDVCPTCGSGTTTEKTIPTETRN